MTISLRLLLLNLLAASFQFGTTIFPVQATEPVQVIFDTDITGDVDDVLALAMLHTLSDRRECDLLAVTVSKINPLTGPFTDAVNTFYGRPDIPIGVTRNAQQRESKYLHLVLKKKNSVLKKKNSVLKKKNSVLKKKNSVLKNKDDQFLYPHDVTSNADLPDAVLLLRKTLAASADHCVVIIQVGLASNLADLLDSKPDKFSSLSGIELVRRKVRLVSVMAGNFKPVNGNKHFLEANVRNGIIAMQRFAKQWPEEVPIIWSGFEIGIGVRYPRQSIAKDFHYCQHHIVSESYLLHSGPNHDRPCWDLTSVLYAVRPTRGYFNLSETGLVRVEDDGYLFIEPGKSKRDRFLKMNPKQTIRVSEALQFLVTQPPLKNCP